MITTKMKAMVLESFHHPLLLRDLPVPNIGPEDALIRVLFSGVCGTDMKIIKGLIPAPIIQLPHVLGHESAGEVVAVGSRVDHIKIGERVVVYFYVGCGVCRWCQQGRGNLCLRIKRCGFELPGGFAQYQKVPARHLCRTGELDPKHAAILPDAVATSYHAVKVQGRVSICDRVLIVGGGGLGIHAAQISDLCGSDTLVVDINQEKLDRIKDLIPTIHIINSNETDPRQFIQEWTQGEGVDVVIETVGHPDTLCWSLPSLKRGGRLVIVGYTPQNPFPLDTMAMHYNEWEIVGSRASTQQELEEVIQLVQQKKIVPVVDRTFSLEMVNQALKEVEDGRAVGRLVLEIGD